MARNGLRILDSRFNLPCLDSNTRFLLVASFFFFLVHNSKPCLGSLCGVLKLELGNELLEIDYHVEVRSVSAITVDSVLFRMLVIAGLEFLLKDRSG